MRPRRRSMPDSIATRYAAGCFFEATEAAQIHGAIEMRGGEIGSWRH